MLVAGAQNWAHVTIGFEFFMYAVVFGHASTIPDESAADSVQESAPALLSQYPSAGGRSAGNTRRGGSPMAVDRQKRPQTTVARSQPTETRPLVEKMATRNFSAIKV